MPMKNDSYANVFLFLSFNWCQLLLNILLSVFIKFMGSNLLSFSYIKLFTFLFVMPISETFNGNDFTF